MRGPGSPRWRGAEVMDPGLEGRGRDQGPGRKGSSRDRDWGIHEWKASGPSTQRGPAGATAARPDAPTRRRTGPRTLPPPQPVAVRRSARPHRASAGRSTRWPDLSSLAVMTPSSLGMSSAAVTASWCPSILLRSTGRLLCGLEWISAAMFARRQRWRPLGRAAHQLTAGRAGTRGFRFGTGGRVGAEPP